MRCTGLLWLWLSSGHQVTERMRLYPPFQMRLPTWAEWPALVLMSLAAPLIAACIQSVYIFRSDHWIYQAVIGGAYFHAVEKPGLFTLLFIVGSCGVFAVPTFLML